MTEQERLAMQRLSQEVRSLREDHETYLGFSGARWRRALLANDPGFAEMMTGALLIALRGVHVALEGFVYNAVTSVLGGVGITSGWVGALLMVAGIAQIAAAGTCRYRLRALVAFGSAVPCLIVWLAHLGVGREESAAALTWAALAGCEAVLTCRILLSGIAHRTMRA